MKPLLLNLELSRRIELAEATAAAAAVETMQRERPDAGAAAEEIAGGYMVYAGANSPITQAIGIGMSGEVSHEEIDRIESWYRLRKEPVRVETSPLADPSLFKLFGANGYEATEFTNVMARSMTGDERFPMANPQIQIERVATSKLDLWAHTVSQGFAGEMEVKPEILDLMGMFARTEGMEC